MEQGKGGPDPFTMPDGGTPFERFRWRTTPELNVHYVWRYICTQKPEGHSMKIG